MDQEQIFYLLVPRVSVWNSNTSFFTDISDVSENFDTSNFETGHALGIPTGVNKKVMEMIKDEAGGNIIEESVDLQSKLLYAYKMFEGEEEKRWKGVNKNVVKRSIRFEVIKSVCLQRKSKRGKWIWLEFISMMYTQKRQTRLPSQQTTTKGLYSMMESIHLHAVFSYKSILQSDPYKNCPYIDSKPFLDSYETELQSPFFYYCRLFWGGVNPVQLRFVCVHGVS